MSFKYFVGVDTSKQTLDFSILRDGSEFLEHQIVNNNRKEITAWFSQVKKEFGIKKTNSLFCLKHTGLYNHFLLSILEKKKAKTWLETPLRIKKSLGIQRGKNDKIDSLRIAQYAYRHKDNYEPWTPPRPEILKLKKLIRLRNRLQVAYNLLQHSIQEHQNFLGKKASLETKVNCDKSLQALKMDFTKVNKTILFIINGDTHLHHLYQILTSVPFVGPVIATELIITTNEFKKFTNAKKFACYCGIAPFEHSSGISIRGRTKVSQFANRKMKTLIHMAAVASVRRPGELKTYFNRKVAEGQHKMSIINAIRNKIIHRIFACIKEDRPFEKREMA
jgi:transposase